MSVESNKAVARKVYELLDTRKFGELKSVAAPDLVDHNPMFPDQEPGLEGELQLVETFAGAFPDYRHVIEDQVAEGDKVVTRYSWNGTHLGNLASIPATKKRVEGRGIEIVRIVNGKITEIWRLEDELGLMRQLGVIPEMEEMEEGEAGR